MKKFILIFILLNLNNCFFNLKQHFITGKSEPINQKKTSDNKVALVGFNTATNKAYITNSLRFDKSKIKRYPKLSFLNDWLESRFSENNERGGFLPLIKLYNWKNIVSNEIAFIDNSKDLKSAATCGLPLNKLNSSSKNETITEEKIYSFIEKGLEEQFGYTGLTELTSLFEQEVNENKIYLPDRQIDYYVIGVLGPPWQSSSITGSVIRNISIFFFIISLGIIPMVGDTESESKFYIYDKDLKLKKIDKQSSSLWYIISWWIFSDTKNTITYSQLSFTPDSVYQDDINRFCNNFPKLVESIKNE